MFIPSYDNRNALEDEAIRRHLKQCVPPSKIVASGKTLTDVYMTCNGVITDDQRALLSKTRATISYNDMTQQTYVAHPRSNQTPWMFTLFLIVLGLAWIVWVAWAMYTNFYGMHQTQSF